MYLPPGSEPPPARMEPSRYLRTSSGVTLPMSAWTICPTFSSTVIVARSALMRCSSAASSGKGQAPSGHAVGVIVPVAETPGAAFAPSVAVRSALQAANAISSVIAVTLRAAACRLRFSGGVGIFIVGVLL